MIIRRFVLRDGAPIQRFRRHGEIAETICDFRIQPLRVCELLVHERHPRNAQLETSAKPLLRQIAFDAVAFDTFGIKDQNRGRPNRVEAFEVRGMFLDMRFKRDEVLIDEVGGFVIGIGLGFQPSTCASSRRG